MTALYLFAAAAGVPLVAWFMLSGGEEDGGDNGDSFGGLMLRLLPLTSVAIVLATFGLCGLLLGAIGTAPTTTLLVSGAAGAGAGVLNSAVFGYIRRSQSTTAVADDQLAGLVARVVLPVLGEHRGRIALSVGGQQLYMSARALPASPAEELEVGAAVLVVEARNGVAIVTRLDPELA